MKKFRMVIVAVFFLMAVALGWFLPLASFNFYDSINEGKTEELEIQKINLNYRDDLLINQKISIVNYDFYIDENIRIDKGIYIQEKDVKRIVSDFLADFTGLRYDLENDFFAEPWLINLSNNRGTIVIWVVECMLPSGWSFQCFVDDKSGAILKCGFYGGLCDWADLVTGFYDFEAPEKGVTEKFCNALYKHYSGQISAKLVNHFAVDDWEGYDSKYRLVFRDEKNYTFEVTVTVSLDGTTIATT